MSQYGRRENKYVHNMNTAKLNMHHIIKAGSYLKSRYCRIQLRIRANKGKYVWVCTYFPLILSIFCAYLAIFSS